VLASLRRAKAELESQSAPSTAVLPASGYSCATVLLRVDERLLVELERHVVQPWPDYDLGYKQCVRLLSRHIEFDAILAYSDAIAIGALRALHERTSLQVPQDVSIIGFDALAVGQYIVPKLTSVGVPWYRVALAALEAVISLMPENRPRAAPVQQFEPELLSGESVVSAPGVT
jgi:DNA-binding LacI/PurR family transcriptional regulator